MDTQNISPAKVDDFTTSSGTECWRVHYDNGDGTVHLHVFPKDTLLWRSIEYGIDVGDVDTLLDVILHEPFVDSPLDPANAETDPAAQAGLTVDVVEVDLYSETAKKVPLWLYNAPDTASAREAHLLRIEHAKQNKKRVVVRPDGSSKGRMKVADPLDTIRGFHRDVLALIDADPRVTEIYNSMRRHIRETKLEARAANRRINRKRYPTEER